MNNRKRFGSMTVIEETVFFISCDDIFPGLYKSNLTDKKVECLGELPWERYYDENALLEKIDDVIVIAPRWHRNRFLIYDLNLSEFHTIYLNQEVWLGDTSISAFSNVAKLGESLFFIGNKNGIIVEYNSKKKQFYIHNLEIPKELSKEELSFFWDTAILEKNVIYLPIKKGGLLKIDLKKFHLDYIEIKEEYQCFKISRIENTLWIMPYYGNRIMLFDLKSENQKFIDLPIEEKNTPFMTAVDFNREVLLIPMFDENIIGINKCDHRVYKKKKFVIDDLKREQTKRQFLSIYKDANEKVYLQKNGNRKLWIFHKTGKFEEVFITIPFENIRKIFENSKTLRKMNLAENRETKLGFLFQLFKYGRDEKNQMNENYGINIWKFLKIEV